MKYAFFGFLQKFIDLTAMKAPFLFFISTKILNDVDNGIDSY